MYRIGARKQKSVYVIPIRADIRAAHVRCDDRGTFRISATFLKTDSGRRPVGAIV